MDDTPGAPLETTVDIGTKVQSVPGPDEKPQTFETVEKITARVEWNAIKPQIDANIRAAIWRHARLSERHRDES